VQPVLYLFQNYYIIRCISLSLQILHCTRYIYLPSIIFFQILC
jgi:hypothetical protein